MKTELRTILKYTLYAAIIAFILSLTHVYLDLYSSTPSSKWLEHPWNQNNLKVYINDTNLPEKGRQSYIYDAKLALKWWESGGNQRLSYGVNFTVVNSSSEANITINWAEKIYEGEREGTTDINNSGNRGSHTCDTLNPPFTKCNISLTLGFSDIKTQRIIMHELGHALGLTHSFNTKDYFAAMLGENYINDPSDIMFDGTIVNAINEWWWIFFVIIFFTIILFKGQKESKENTRHPKKNQSIDEKT